MSIYKTCWKAELTRQRAAGEPLRYTNCSHKCDFGCQPPRMPPVVFLERCSPIPMPIAHPANKERWQRFEDVVHKPEYFDDETARPSREREEELKKKAAESAAFGGVSERCRGWCCFWSRCAPACLHHCS